MIEGVSNLIIRRNNVPRTKTVMEPIGFALALSSVPGIFNSCVQCFRYIQLGREFENDFERTLCKLEAAEMRLSRWGASMGIDSPETKLREENFNEEDIERAYRWLKEIERAFDSAIETSNRYKSIAKPEKVQLLDTDVEVHNRSNFFQKLHYSMRKINEQRVRPRKRDRMAWALYRKTSFEWLIEETSELIHNLVGLFPSTIEMQKQLCKEEIQDLDTESLRLLNEVVEDEDELLKDVLRAEVRPDVFSHIEVADHFRGHFGDNVASGENTRNKVYSHIKGGGNAIAHFGNTIGNFQGRMVYEEARNPLDSGD